MMIFFEDFSFFFMFIFCYFAIGPSDIKLIVLVLFAEIIGFIFKIFSSFLSVHIGKTDFVMMSVDFILWFNLPVSNSI